MGEPVVARFVVQRNQSLSAVELATVLSLGLVFHLALGVAAGLAGWWPVVGFVGAGFLLFAGAILVVMSASEAREVISIGERMVVVEYGRHRPDLRVELERYWARVRIREAPQPALVLCSRGVTAEIGGVLTPRERRELARRLGGLVGPSAGAIRAEGPVVATV